MKYYGPLRNAYFTRASIGLGGIEIVVQARFVAEFGVASIGLGGIEIEAVEDVAGPQPALQSDWEELKYLSLPTPETGAQGFNRTGRNRNLMRAASLTLLR